VTQPALDRYDTIVIGAGPAGIMAALHAAERGSVLLAEAAALPRDKSCGGMLHEMSQDFLAPYGTIPESIILKPRHVNFRYVDWDRRIRKPTELRFVNVDRAGFDDWLLSLLPSGVEVVGECTLASFEQDSAGVAVSLKSGDAPLLVRCENLIGADGARSAVRRSLGAGSASSYVTLQDYVELDGDLPLFFDCIYMRDIGDSFAYAYVVPKGDRAIVGSVFYPKTKRPWEKQDMALGILRSAMPQLGASVKREAAAALYLRSHADVVPGAGRVLLAGEAGGFMSPTSGEGISYALKSGAAAGRAVAASSPDAALGTYRVGIRTLDADIRRRLRWLPFMESEAGKYLAGFVPASLVSRVTKGL
jgi:flavin-dependent dehydrogenase